MDLVVLGAGPSYSDEPGALGASYLVVDGEHALVLDFGQGVFPSLVNVREPSGIAAILISHLHPDHFIDLVALRHYLRYEFDPPRRVRVIGPVGLGDRLDALHAEPGFAAAALDVEAVGGPSRRSVGSFTIEAGLVTHTNESYGYRVSAPSGGPALVYSGDCGRVDDLGALVQPGDVVLTEVSFGAGPVPPGAFHLDGPAIGRMAAARGPSRVILTHLQMGNDRYATIASVHASGYDGPVEFAWPGLHFPL